MTEADWLACDTSWLLYQELACTLSRRPVLLFTAACLRRVWDLLDQRAHQFAVEVTEQYADGLVSRRDLLETWSQAEAETDEGIWVMDGWWCDEEQWAEFGAEGSGAILKAAEAALAAPAWTAARAAFHARSLVAWDAGATARESKVLEESLTQFALLHDLTYQHPQVSRPNPEWLWGNGATVHRLARTIYAERRFGWFPLLADALEDAGCVDEQILGHLRGPGPHARGCWCLDILVNKS
jgi:hypothetical protein